LSNVVFRTDEANSTEMNGKKRNGGEKEKKTSEEKGNSVNERNCRLDRTSDQPRGGGRGENKKKKKPEEGVL